MAPDARSVFDSGRPAVEVCELDESSLGVLHTEILREHPDAVVKLLSGDRMRTLKGTTQELSAALQLPPYVWASWDSIADALSELCYDGAPSHLLIVRDAARLLTDEGDGLLGFVDVVTEQDRGCPQRFRALLVQPRHALWELEQRLEGFPIEVGRPQ